MTKVHFLNVNDGDCIVLEHDSRRLTVFDISAGNSKNAQQPLVEALAKGRFGVAPGNFQMCGKATNPIDYIQGLTDGDVWRFVLSHPDMDHLDGFNALLNRFRVLHFWDSGARRTKPDFGGTSRFNEQDWDRYARVIDGREEGTQVVQVKAGAKFKFANQGDSLVDLGDSLSIVSPNASLIDKANRVQKFNDASYVVLYESPIGKILLTGDAHDETWEHIGKHYKSEVSDVTLLMAPHHGRKSDRSYRFLDYVRPKLTLFGCAPSEHLAYDAWNYRKLRHITNNQCGSIVAEGLSSMDVYVENRTFAEKCGGDVYKTNAQGFYYLLTVDS